MNNTIFNILHKEKPTEWKTFKFTNPMKLFPFDYDKNIEILILPFIYPFHTKINVG